ncbi:MAG TPA: phosphatase PAP2 family protein [Candidatus Acidoferrum sp.]|nr:phosphatase PAP2 family protein [Candidatus Acidoferrum sp.]
MSLWLGAASLSFGIFVKITSELLEHEVRGLDSSILTAVARMRRPWLSGIAVDITALGSFTLVTLISAIALCVLLSLKDRPAAWQLLLNSVGAGIWTELTKNIIERTRPVEVTHLVQDSGFSYPSGHSLASAALYLTLAILAGRHLPTTKGRVLVYCLAVIVILLVGMSRLYLGVHYPSDVASGVLLGAAWALLLAGGFSMIERRAS